MTGDDLRHDRGASHSGSLHLSVRHIWGTAHRPIRRPRRAFSGPLTRRGGNWALVPLFSLDAMPLAGGRCKAHHGADGVIGRRLAATFRALDRCGRVLLSRMFLSRDRTLRLR